MRSAVAAMDPVTVPRHQALERLVGDCFAAPTLERQGGDNLARDLSDRVHEPAVPSFAGASRPLSREQHAMEAMAKETRSTEKNFSRDEHLRRISDALRSRMYPNTPLHAKVLGNAIGVTARTILNWVNGRCDPGAYEFGRLCDYFERCEGSPMFRCAVYGDDIGLAMARRAALAQRMVEAAEELKAMEA